MKQNLTQGATSATSATSTSGATPAAKAGSTNFQRYASSAWVMWVKQSHMQTMVLVYLSLDWFKGKITGKPNI
jgi:hypothetical protein